MINKKKEENNNFLIEIKQLKELLNTLQKEKIELQNNNNDLNNELMTLKQQKPIEIIKEIIKEVEKPIETIKYVDKIIEKEKIIEKPIETIKYVDKIIYVDKPITVNEYVYLTKEEKKELLNKVKDTLNDSTYYSYLYKTRINSIIEEMIGTL